MVMPDQNEMIWNNLLLLKVSTFTWRFQNNLATKGNMVRQGVTQLDSLLCLGECGFNETSSHLFFECDFFCNLWRGVVICKVAEN
jgi:hypothetical protein